MQRPEAKNTMVNQNPTLYDDLRLKYAEAKRENMQIIIKDEAVVQILADHEELVRLREEHEADLDRMETAAAMLEAQTALCRKAETLLAELCQQKGEAEARVKRLEEALKHIYQNYGYCLPDDSLQIVAEALKENG